MNEVILFLTSEEQKSIFYNFSLKQL